MIITCSCGVRLKVADDKLTAAGVKVKCPKCATVHVARKEASTPAPSPAAAPAAPQTAPAMPWFAGSSPAPQKGGALVLVAHDSTVVADMINSVLKEAGMATDYAPNGLEALKKATELKPQAMVVDVGLTGIYGFELCERLKGDKATKHIKIVLLSSVYGLTAYKRSPVTLYGADDYIEKHHIPDQLVPKLKRLLYGEGEAAPAPASPEPEQPPAAPLVSQKGVVQHAPTVVAPSQPAAPVSVPASTPPTEPKRGFEVPDVPSILPKTPVTLGGEAAPRRSVTAAPSPPPPVREAPPAAPATAAPAHADGSVKLDADFFEHEEYEAPATPAAAAAAADPAEIEKARRFARLIVSDIALYNQEVVAEGIQSGTLFDLLKDDIAEGRNLYDSRVPPAIRATKDYLQEAFDNFIASKKKLR